MSAFVDSHANTISLASARGAVRPDHRVRCRLVIHATPASHSAIDEPNWGKIPSSLLARVGLIDQKLDVAADLLPFRLAHNPDDLFAGHPEFQPHYAFAAFLDLVGAGGSKR